MGRTKPYTNLSFGQTEGRYVWNWGWYTENEPSVMFDQVTPSSGLGIANEPSFALAEWWLTALQ